jgi:hypothetical protein
MITTATRSLPPRGLARGLQLIAGTGQAHADAGRHGAAGAQVVDHPVAHDPHRRLQGDRFGGNDAQGHHAAAVHAADAVGVDGLDDARDVRQGHHGVGRGVEGQGAQVVPGRALAHPAVQVDVDRVVVQQEFVDEGPVGERGDRKADIRGAHAQLGDAGPVRAQLDQGLGQGQGGGIGLDTRVVDDLLGPSVGREGDLVEGAQLGSGDVEIDTAGATVVAGDDGAARDEGAHARVLLEFAAHVANSVISHISRRS